MREMEGITISSTNFKSGKQIKRRYYRKKSNKIRI